MSIGQRINARKIALWYIYRDLFFKEPTPSSYHAFPTQEEWSLTHEEVDIDYDFMTTMWVQEEYEKNKEMVPVEWKSWLSDDQSDDLAMITNGLHIEPKEVDWWFVYQLIDAYPHYIKKVSTLIGPLLTQFQRDELDPIKKTIFILWYTEYKTSKGTDDKVIINEMIELSKRFWWIELYKLTNSIFHKLLIKEE